MPHSNLTMPLAEAKTKTNELEQFLPHVQNMLKTMAVCPEQVQRIDDFANELLASADSEINYESHILRLVNPEGTWK